MAMYKFLPNIKIEITAQEWNIQNLEGANNIASLMSEKLSLFIQEAWVEVSEGKSFSFSYRNVERKFERIHESCLKMADSDCMKVFYKVLDNFFPEEMVEKVKNHNLLNQKNKEINNLT